LFIGTSHLGQGHGRQHGQGEEGDDKGDEDGQTTASEPHGDPLKVSAAAPTNRSTKLDRGRSDMELVSGFWLSTDGSSLKWSCM
jgi:hypothetical protein